MKLTTHPVLIDREFSHTDLNLLQRQLRDWRRRQRGRARLPDSVWRSAAALARSLGASHVARTLGLGYYKLKRRMCQGADGQPVDPPPALFVELALGGLSGADGLRGYRAEVSNGTPDRLTLHLDGDVSAVVALAEACWRRRP